MWPLCHHTGLCILGLGTLGDRQITHCFSQQMATWESRALGGMQRWFWGLAHLGATSQSATPHTLEVIAVILSCHHNHFHWEPLIHGGMSHPCKVAGAQDFSVYQRTGPAFSTVELSNFTEATLGASDTWRNHPPLQPCRDARFLHVLEGGGGWSGKWLCAASFSHARPLPGVMQLPCATCPQRGSPSEGGWCLVVARSCSRKLSRGRGSRCYCSPRPVPKVFVPEPSRSITGGASALVGPPALPWDSLTWNRPSASSWLWCNHITANCFCVPWIVYSTTYVWAYSSFQVSGGMWEGGGPLQLPHIGPHRSWAGSACMCYNLQRKS